MEEQVIQETPVASSEQPVAETPNTVNIDVSAYEQKIQALQQRASEAEEKFQGIKGKLDEVYKNKMISVVRRWKIKVSGKTFGRKPTKLLKAKTNRLLIWSDS